MDLEEFPPLLSLGFSSPTVDTEEPLSFGTLLACLNMALSNLGPVSFLCFLQNHTFLALSRNIFFCREMYVYLPCNECKYKFYTHLHQLCSYLSLVRRITFFAVVIFHSYMSYTSQIYLYHSDFWPFFCLGRLTWSHLWNHQSELCRSHYRGETYSLLNNFWLLAVALCLRRLAFYFRKLRVALHLLFPFMLSCSCALIGQYLLFMGVYMISWILHAFWLVFTKHATCTVWQGTISKFVYLFYLQLYLRK